MALSTAPPIPPKRRSSKFSGRSFGETSKSRVDPLSAQDASGTTAKSQRPRRASVRSPRATAKCQEIRSKSVITELENLHDVTSGEDDLTDSEGITDVDDDSEEEEPMKVDLEPAKLTRTISARTPV